MEDVQRMCQYFFESIHLNANIQDESDVLYLCRKIQEVSEEKSTNKQRKLKIAKLLEDLAGGVPSKVTTALDALQVYGDESIIEPLIQSLDKQKDEKSIAEIVEFLSSLKSSKAVEKVMEILADPAYRHQQVRILSTIWNSPLDYSNYLATFVALAVQNDFLVALECLTILENLEGPFEEGEIMESQLLLKEYHDGIHPKDKQKDHLVSEIALLIKDMDRMAD